MLVASLAAAVLAGAPCRHPAKHSHRCRTHAAVRDPAPTAERLLRRRVVRMAHIAYLERRQALLAEFLVRAETEQPVLRDERRLVFGPLTIGPAMVSRDFLGSPVIRVRVRNDGAAAMVLITARLRSASRAAVETSVAAHLLAHEEARDLQLSVPQDFVPVSIDWDVMLL